MKRICIAIDKSNEDFSLKDFSQNLHKDIVLKVGLEYITKFGLNAINNLQHDVFVDLKLYDIPNTVACAVKNLSKINNVKFLTIHASGGVDMIRAAMQSRVGNAKILCVTKLTSQSANIDDILKLTELALSAGAEGVVCSALECVDIRKKFGNEICIVTPGIRPEWYTSDDDQVRVTTPRQAFNFGSNLIVIGRPVMQHASPKEAIEKIFQECSTSV